MSVLAPANEHIPGDVERGGQQRGWLGFALRLVLSVGLLGAAFWLSSDTLDWSQLRALDGLTLATCVVLSAIVLLLLAWRWHFVVVRLADDNGIVPRFYSFFRLTWICLAINQVLPSVIGGDAARISLLTGQGVPISRAAGSVVVDRLFGLIGLALLTLTGVHMLNVEFAVPVLLLALAVVVGSVVFFMGSRMFLAQKLRGILLANAMSARASVLMIVAAMAGHLANIAIFLVVAHALGADLPIIPAIAVMSSVLLISFLPLSIAGWGVREIVLVQAFSHLGLDTKTIMLASVTYGLVLFLTQSLGFLLFVGRNRP